MSESPIKICDQRLTASKVEKLRSTLPAVAESLCDQREFDEKIKEKKG